MQIEEVDQLEFDRSDTNRLIFSQDGRFIIYQRADSLEVVELKSETKKFTNKYIMEDETISTYFPIKVAFFDDYVVLVSIKQEEEQGRYLKLLRFNFRTGSSQKLDLPFPNIDWNNRLRQRGNFYPGLPADVSEIYISDYIYFEDQRLMTIFQTDKIVVEDKFTDYQLINVNNLPQLLLGYNLQLPSPFTMPYVFQWINMSYCRIRKYKNGVCPQSHLWILDKYATINTYSDSVYIMTQFLDERILMTSRTKILRKFDFIQQSELGSHFIVIKHGSLTLLLDVRTAMIFKITDQGDTILRGNHVFTVIKSTDPLKPNQSQIQVRRLHY